MPEPGTRVGSYRIERLIGRGGMGAVYLAFDTTLHRHVALKVVDATADADALRNRVLREARSAAALNHPHICTIYEVGDAEGSAFIAMEYIEGCSLRDRLSEGPLAPADAIRYGIQAADALAYAHGRGVIHRDLKSANAMVAETGHLKIVDFGLARRADALTAAATTLESVVPAGVVAGTPYAMAPEQVRGDATDPHTDVWALGVLLYELIAGTGPFKGSTSAELFASILRDAPATLPDAAPDDLKTLIERCLAKDANARGTAGEVRERLEAIALGAAAFQKSSPTRPAADDLSGALARASRRRLLVLPFANISPHPDTEYFADGLTEELIADLSRLKSLLVISRNSAMKLKQRTKDTRTLAADLGVDFVLDGSVRKTKGALRITAQLIDATTDVPIWADKFTGSDEDVFDLQERLSRQIIDAMRIELTHAEAGPLFQRPIADVRAYDLYLRAREKLRRVAAQDLDDAVLLLREGLELLGANELLLGTLGQAYLHYISWGVRPDPRYFGEAQRCADSLLRRWPESPYGHALVGGLEAMQGNLQGAVRHLKGALAADRGNTEAVFWLSYCYLTAGQPRSARPLIEHALRTDPLTSVNHGVSGWLKISEGKPDEALRHYQRACELDPTSPLARSFVGWSLAQAGRRTEAIEWIAALTKDAAGTALGELHAGLAHGLAGDAVAARNAIGALAAAAGQHDAAFAHALSEVYALAGDFDQAYRWLEQAAHRGYLDYPFLASVDPLYEGGFRSDPRFLRLMSELQRRWQAFEV